MSKRKPNPAEIIAMLEALDEAGRKREFALMLRRYRNEAREVAREIGFDLDGLDEEGEPGADPTHRPN